MPSESAPLIEPKDDQHVQMDAGAAAGALAKALRDMVVKRHDFSCDAIRQKMDEWAEEEPGLASELYINIGNANGKTALHFASQLRSDGLTELLLERRAEVERNTVRGHTALIYAAGRGRDAEIRTLLAARASCRVRTANGDTALGMASGRCCDDVVEVLRQAERTENNKWKDFTKLQKAIVAQADHVERSHKLATWDCDVPDAVADILAQRSRERELSSKNVTATRDALSETIAREVADTWSDNFLLAELLLRQAKALGPKRCSVLRKAMVIAAEAGDPSREILSERVLSLAKVASGKLLEVSRPVLAAHEPTTETSPGMTPTAAAATVTTATTTPTAATQSSDVRGTTNASNDNNNNSISNNNNSKTISSNISESLDKDSEESLSTTAPSTRNSSLSESKRLKESQQDKEARVAVTNSVLGALKELVPKAGLSAADLDQEAPAWMTVEVFSQASALELPRDGPALRDALKRLCHQGAWGSDFGAALRWLRSVRPQVCHNDASREQSVAAREAYEGLLEEFASSTLLAVQSGHSLCRHLRDNDGLSSQVREVLGPELSEPILAICSETSKGGNVHLRWRRGSSSESCEISKNEDSKDSSCKKQLASKYANLPYMELPKSLTVTFIDTEAKAKEFQSEVIHGPVRLVAIDTEWWDIGRGPALVQIAATNSSGSCIGCWLLDTLRFPELVAPILWDLLHREDAELLGWSFGEDLKRLQELFDATGLEDSIDFNITDLQPPSCKVISKTSALVSLSVACGHFLGKCLNKEQQCSDWRNRPLSSAQTIYAALDAIALLDLHSALKGNGAL